MKMITTSADKKHSFTFETESIEEAKKFLDFVREHGYDAAQQYVQRIGCTCRDTYIAGVGKVINSTGCPVHTANR